MAINPALLDVVFDHHDGYPSYLAAEDTRDALLMAAGDAAVTSFPEHLWIEQKDWATVAAENDRYLTWPINYLDRTTNQGAEDDRPGTHECTTHALRAVAECARNRQRRIQLGPPIPGEQLPISAKSASVWLSCLSIYAEANPRKWGGASTRQVLEIATRRGFLPDTKQPRDWKFQHTMIGTCGKGNATQSSGAWVPLSKFPEGWNLTAKHFRPLEVIFPESYEQIVSLVLNGIAVGVGRSGHSIPYVQWMPKDNVMAYLDSYDIIRYDSVRMIKAAVGGAYAIVTMTTPDNWDNPASQGVA